MLQEFASFYFRGLAQCYQEVPLEKLERAVEALLRAQREGRTIFILGNGGSASTASHMAVDLGKGTSQHVRPRFRVISLADNIGLITAWANDASYDVVFKEQLENLLQPGDVVIAISASGNSPNVLRAVEYANQHGATTIGLIGFGGGKLKDLVQIDLTVSSRNYGQVEDFHLSLNHIFSQYPRELTGSRASSRTSGTNGNGLRKMRLLFSDRPKAGTRPAILFDRDGVINERIFPGYVTQWKQFRFRDGIQETLARLSELGLPIIVLSNQAGVGKGLLSAETLSQITRQFVAELKAAGARIDAVYYCPHTLEDGCRCRKPRPGLLRQAARDWRLDLRRSILVGDSESDLETARALRCKAILLAPVDYQPASVEPLGADALRVGSISEICRGLEELLNGQLRLGIGEGAHA